MSTLADARAELARLADPAKANVLQRFFKTGKSQYGEGDVFMGVTVPRSRQVATKYAGITLEDVKGLLYSKIHEERLLALLILVRKSKADLEGGRGFTSTTSLR